MSDLTSVVSKLAPYFSREKLEEIAASKNPFYTALAIADFADVYHYLTTTSSNVYSDQSNQLHSEIAHLLQTEVTAYTKFTSVSDGADMTKDTYLRKYSIPELLPAEMRATSISMSSGSSGKAYFWPRGNSLELETTLIYELMLRESFSIHTKKTLLINAYSMGVWVAGVFTATAALHMAQRGSHITTVNTGINSDLVLETVKSIGNQFEQIIIAGYPPFIKDIIEEGIRLGINWQEYSPKFIFGAEAIGEEWRDYLHNLVGSKDPYHTSVNTYGSADAAILGHETPLSILIKRLLKNHPDLWQTYGNQQDVATLVQYHPAVKHFTQEGDEILLSCLGGLPLLNYNLHDRARLISFEELENAFAAKGVDLRQEAAQHGITVFTLPFIYLFGKSDQTVTLYGLNVYPQTIREALEQPKVFGNVTGRVQIATSYTESQDQYLEITVEVREGIALETLSPEGIADQVTQYLVTHSSEYAALREKIGEKSNPFVVLVPYGSFSSTSIKQAWVRHDHE
jgi:phenylacetate-CoA ligase